MTSTGANNFFICAERIIKSIRGQDACSRLSDIKVMVTFDGGFCMPVICVSSCTHACNCMQGSVPGHPESVLLVVTDLASKACLSLFL